MSEVDLMRMIVDLQTRLAKLETADVPSATTVPVGANPTATAGPTAVNGSAATFMRSDGAPAVGVANPSATAGKTAVNGSAATFMRSDAAPAIGDSDKTDGFHASATPGASTIAVSDGSGKLDGWVTANPTAANPSANVGTSAVNGAAATFMRSDGAPPIDQAIVPTWTGAHTFNADVTVGEGKNIVLGTTTGTKIGTSTTQKLGFFNSAPVVKGTAFTQTYNTASHTVAALTGIGVTNSSGGSGSTVSDAGIVYSQSQTNINNFALADQLNKLTADHAVLIKAFTALVDDLQALGLIS